MDEYEEILASKRAVRVLGIVAEFGEISISELARKAGIDHLVADMIVKQLTGFDLLLDEYHGKNRIIKINFRSYKIKFIRDQGVETQVIL
jgi:predicted transcriptional regulator